MKNTLMYVVPRSLTMTLMLKALNGTISNMETKNLYPPAL